MKLRRRLVRFVVQSLLFVGGLAVVYLLFQDIETEKLFASLSSVSWRFILLLLPFVAIVALDTVAWKALLRNLGRDVPSKSLAATRVATEAVILTLPGGLPLAETLKPFLLNRAGNVDYPTGAASVILKKCFIAIGQGTYVLLAATMGYFFLTSAIDMPGVNVAFLLGSAGIVLITVGIGGIIFVTTKDGVRKFQRVVRVLPGRAWKESSSAAIQKTHEILGKFRTFRPSVIARITCIFVCAWMMESVESYLLLSFLSPGVPFTHVLPMEITVSLVRGLMFIVPGAVGVQELGYATFLASMGLPDPVTTAAAFSVLKRSKEAVIASVGYAILAVLVRRKPAEVQMHVQVETA